MPFISLVRIGDVSAGVCEAVAKGVSRRIGLPCLISEEVVDPDFSYDARRGQYCSPRLLKRLRDRADAQAMWVLGVADVDLFMPVLTFVFGEGILGGNAAVISIHRLHQTFYGMPDDPALMLLRAEREAVHELGHTFGLIHCPDYTCTMHATRSVEEIDLASGGLCRSCGQQVEEVVRAVAGSGHSHLSHEVASQATAGLPTRWRRPSLRSVLSTLFPFLKSSSLHQPSHD